MKSHTSNASLISSFSFKIKMGRDSPTTSSTVDRSKRRKKGPERVVVLSGEGPAGITTVALFIAMTDSASFSRVF